MNGSYPTASSSPLLLRSDEAGDSSFILRTDQLVQRREEIQVSGKQGKVPGVVKLIWTEGSGSVDTSG